MGAMKRRISNWHLVVLTAGVLLAGAYEKPAAAQQAAIRETPPLAAVPVAAGAADQAAARQHIERGDSLRNGPHGGDPVGAASEYRLAQRSDPSSAEAHYDLANVLPGGGDKEAAILEYQQAIHLDMPDPNGPAQHPLQTAEAYRQLGIIRQAKNQLISATANFRASLRLEPNNSQTHLGLAFALECRELYAAAIPEYQAALRLDPTGQRGVDTALAHNNLGVCDTDLKDYAAALPEYHAVLHLTPNAYHPHCNLGTALLGLKRYPEAIREFRESLRLNPQYAFARNSLGMVLYNSGQEEAGRIEWRKVLRTGDADAVDVACELLADSTGEANVSP